MSVVLASAAILSLLYCVGAMSRAAFARGDNRRIRRASLG